jgi:hypothetical protein
MSEDGWREEIEKCCQHDPSLEWSILVRVETGEVVWSWTQAGGFRFVDWKGQTWEEFRPVAAPGAPP